MPPINPYRDLEQTPGLREAMRLAAHEAKFLGADSVGPEHLLLGMVRKGGCLGFQVLLNMRIDPDKLRDALLKHCEPTNQLVLGMPTKNVATARVMEGAREISRQLRHEWLGTEHLLLALIRVEGTLAHRVLREEGVEFDRALAEALAIIAEAKPATKPQTAK